MKRLLFFLLCLFVPWLGFGQKIIFKNETKRNSIPVRYNRASPGAYINSILDTLAQASGSKRRGLIFFYDKELSIEKDQHKLNFKVKLSEMRYRGNTSYRNFDMSDVMLPHKASFILDWYSGERDRIKSIQIDQVAIDPTNPILLNHEQTDSLKFQDYRISTKGFVFHFDEMNWIEFKSRIDFIDEYYSDNDSIQSKVRHIRNNDFSISRMRNDSLFLPKASRFVHSTKSFIKDISTKNYSQLKVAEGKRVPDLNINLEILNETNRHLFDSVQIVIADAYNAATRKIEKQIAKQDFDGAQQTVTKKLFPLGLYGAGNYYLAEIYYLRKNYDFARKKLILVANKFVVDEKITKKMKLLTMKLNRELLEEALDLIAKHKMDKSLQVIGLATELVNLNNDFKSLTQHNPQLKTLIKRVHDAYSDFGKEQFRTGKFHASIRWFNSAVKLCDDFNVNVCDKNIEESIKESKKEYQNKLVASIIHNVQNYDLEKAEHLLQNEKEFRKENDLGETALMAHAKTVWAEKKYIKNLKEGNKAFNENRHEQALDKFLQARELANNHQFEAVDYLDTLIVYSSERYLDDFIGENPDNEKVSNPGAIEYAAEKIGRIKMLTKTACCKDIDAKTQSLQALLDKACELQSDKFKGYLSQAEESIRNASFLIADSLLQFAIMMTNEYETCGLDPQKAFELKQEIAFGVGYELTLDKVIHEIQNQNYPVAIDQYENLTEYYNVYNLRELGLRHDSLQTFIANTDDIMFINFCIGQFSNMDNFETALFLLNNLYIRGINSDLARNGQIALGIILATKDYRENSGRPVKEMIERYTNGDKWFEHFERVYEIRWEKLQQSENRRR